MLATPPFGASSNIALWRANNKPPVELVVADLELVTSIASLYFCRKMLAYFHLPFIFDRGRWLKNEG